MSVNEKLAEICCFQGFTGDPVVKILTANAGDVGSIPEFGRSLRVEMATPVFLSGKLRGQRSLAGHSLWGHKESDMTDD